VTETPLRWSTRLVLGIGILVGLQGAVVMFLGDSAQYTLASDVYFHAAEAALSGGDIYEVTPPGREGYHYIYPPVVTVLFVPHALLGSELAAFALQTGLNLAVGVATAAVIWRALERRDIILPRIDRVLLAVFVLGSSYGAIQMINGQVTLWLGLAVAIGVDALDRRRETVAGVAFALAALVKVFPAAFGLLLVRFRASRGVLVAVATGLLGLFVGLIAFGPDLTVTYFEDVLLARFENETFDGVPDPSDSPGGIHRQLAAFRVPALLVTPLGLVGVGAPLAVVYRRLDTDLQRQAAAFATVAAVLLFVPLQPLYFPLVVFPLVLLLVLLPSGITRKTLVVGMLVSYQRTDYDQAVDDIEALGLPATVEGTLTDAFSLLFTVVRPAHLGLWIMVGACVLVAVRSVEARDDSGRETDDPTDSGLAEAGGDGS
jgi:hypothetical protein